jgi:RNA polymerase sigma factor (sigma-70 family)
MMFTYESEALSATLPEEEFLPGEFAQDNDEWGETDETDAALDNTTASASLTEAVPEAENLVAQYFGEVRPFALLSFAEEQALGYRITAYRARVRRALCTSPVALPTLTRVWQQVARADIPLTQVIRDVDATTYDQAAWHAQLGEAILRLQDLATRLQQLARPCPVPVGMARERRTRRQERISLWHQWIAICEALRLHPSVYETIRQALDTAQRAQPSEPTLHTAYSAWAHAQQRLEQAKAQMLRANLRLVIHVAHRYHSRGVPLLDLIQEGNIGLMRALDKFEPQRGLKFVTYAHWWVRQAISRAVIEQHRTVRLPGHVVERQNKLRTVGSKLWNAYGRAPSVQELSTALGWTPKEVEEVRAAGQSIIRMHQPITDDGGMLADVLADPQAPKPEELLVEEQLHRRLAECLASLPEREATILRLRYGLETDHPHSLQEIGDLLGVSRERIRQLEKLALEKLRQPQRSALLADFANVA